MSDRLLAFNNALDEASRWLETASSELVSLSEECDGEFLEVRETLSRLARVRTELQTVRDPLLSQIRAAEAVLAQEETFFGE